MPKFICPVCAQGLDIQNKSYVCQNRHTFDIASKGYVNLLPKKNSASPGDDKTMVTARSNFLSKGYYSHLKQALQALCLKYAKDTVDILDCGCGEGYYTQAIYNALNDAGKEISMYGIDISKDAVILSAKRVNMGKFAVASSFHLPIADDSVDILVNCFSPLCVEEFSRVLKRGGIFIYVVPAPKHLWQLKQALYENPYENEERVENYSGFTLIETVEAARQINIDNNEDLFSLFTMTPYFYRSPKDAREKLLSKNGMNVDTHFIIYVYKKN